MTHEELMVKMDYGIRYINYIFVNPNNGAKDIRDRILTNMQALRAVVGLHKPREYKVAGTFTDGFIQTGCVCGGWSYPCPTIQVIEKELA